MAEYSKLAKGSYTSNGSSKVVTLPFIPDLVEVFNYTQAISATANETFGYTWSNVQPPGFALTQSYNASTPTGSVYGALDTGGIYTFSSGLSFSFGPQQAISGIVKQVNSPFAPTTVTTVNPHGYNTGDVVMFEGITGMQQMAGMPFQISYISSTSFSINWNTSGSNYTAISGSPANCYVKKVIFPFLYAPGISFIQGVTTGATTVVTTTAPHNLSVGSEVAFRIPPAWGIVQLNSLPNTKGIPGSPMYGYVIAVNGPTQVTVNINSSGFTAYTSNVPVNQVPGLSFPQILAVGDINSGGTQISQGSKLYPSPLVNGVSTVNGPAIQGSFLNNTSMGFVVIPTGNVNDIFFWKATAFDYQKNEVIIN